jgi:MarR family transcriptional regulator, negative regulator of the multidrug operon emrRAB
MPPLSNLLGALSVGVSDLQSDAMAQAAGVDPTMLAVLLAVHTRPSCSVGDVAKTAHVSHSGAVRAVDRLVSLGLVVRKVNANDRRIVALSCTQAGRAGARRALDVRRTVLDGLFADVFGSRAERAGAKTMLERLLERLAPKRREDAWRICRLCEHEVCRDSDCPVGRVVI